jgi:hypothetical protein
MSRVVEKLVLVLVFEDFRGAIISTISLYRTPRHVRAGMDCYRLLPHYLFNIQAHVQSLSHVIPHTSIDNHDRVAAFPASDTSLQDRPKFRQRHLAFQQRTASAELEDRARASLRNTWLSIVLHRRSHCHVEGFLLALGFLLDLECGFCRSLCRSLLNRLRLGLLDCLLGFLCGLAGEAITHR